MTHIRFAIVTSGARNLDQVRRFLPSNYIASTSQEGAIVIEGEDNAGWTLDGYVIPRLASGLIYAREIYSDESLPICDEFNTQRQGACNSVLTEDGYCWNSRHHGSSH